MNLEELKKKKISDLRYIAKMLGIKSVTTLSKQSLIEGIMAIEGAETTDVEIKPVEISNSENEPEINLANVENKTQKVKKQTKNKPEKAENHKKTRKNKSEKKVVSKENKNSTVDVQSDELAENKKETLEISQQETNNQDKNHKKSQQKSKNKENKEKKSENKKRRADAKNKAQKEEVISETENENENEANVNTQNEDSSLNEDKNKEEVKQTEIGEEAEGFLEILSEGYGFLRTDRFLSGNKDVYVPPTLIRKFALKTGDKINGRSKNQRDNDKYQALFYINTINDCSIEEAFKRKPFETLIPIYPNEKIKLETTSKELSTRLIDLIAPIGKGQRGMIVSPPKAGKTVLLKKIANAITENYPEIHLIVLLIDERPEEVTDMRESVQGEVVASTFDEMPDKHIKVSEMVFERAKRLVEHGHDVVILMDSLTRLARAYNITISPTGRSLSGGLDPGALYNPKRFFGAARNIRDGGSLTIVATALVDTGSKMDDVIFEEFKGTGNMELHLDRKLSEKRIFPAIDINKSGTRKEELLLTEKELNSVFSVRRAMSNLGTGDVTEMIVSKMTKTKNNEEFVNTIKILPPEGSKG